ncbi:hypothetical protein VDGL01_04582 [Verticillium dahliae]
MGVKVASLEMDRGSRQCPYPYPYPLESVLDQDCHIPACSPLVLRFT